MGNLGDFEISPLFALLISSLPPQAGMRPPQNQPPSQHHHHHNNKSPNLVADHCCSCNNCNNYSNNHHAGHTGQCGDKDFYNLCECTSCRNLGNSIDICCQCCSCSAESYPRYHVASMAMQEDTLEVCLQQQTADASSADIDDITLAHNIAERGCYECHTTSQPCCGPRGHRPSMFHSWQQHQQQQRRTQLKGHAGHSCGKGNKRPALLLRCFSFIIILLLSGS